jgi:hypothetical protein
MINLQNRWVLLLQVLNKIEKEWEEKEGEAVGRQTFLEDFQGAQNDPELFAVGGHYKVYGYTISGLLTELAFVGNKIKDGVYEVGNNDSDMEYYKNINDEEIEEILGEEQKND